MQAHGIAVKIKFLLLIGAVLSVTACGGGGSGSTSDAGSNGSVTPSETGDGTGGNTNAGDTPAADPLTDFKSALQGSWLSACRNFSSSGVSIRELNTFTDSTLLRDWYEYDGENCTGAPRGKTYPIRIYAYTIGSATTSTDGKAAYEIDLTIEQISQKGFLRDAARVNEVRYDTIAIDSGRLLRTGAETTRMENRPLSFTERDTFTPRQPLTNGTVSLDNLVGPVWGSNCRSKKVITYVFNTDNSAALTQFFDTEDCSGPVTGSFETKYDIVVDPAYTTVFGDSLLRIREEVTSSTVLSGNVSVEELSLVGSARYRAYSVLSDNTLVTGYCVVNKGDCTRVEDEKPDMIDLEFGRRYRAIN